MRSKRVVALLSAALLAATVTAGCTGDGDPGPGEPTASSTAAVKPARLTFGVWGGASEIGAYQGVVDRYNQATPTARVKVRSYADHDSLKAALDSGEVPDVFLIGRGDLTDLRERGLNQPVGDLLDERDVDFGDGYSRPALEAFASDRQVQCMPYGVSPMVIYYNRELVDFDAMRERELDAPVVGEDNLKSQPAWTLEQFQAAADFADRPRLGVSGFHVASTLRGLAPFVYSGGGSLFDDDEAPTSLAFSSDDTRGALEKVLPLLRDPKLGLTQEEIDEKPALEWFEEGRLGMIAGFRDLTPELRAVSGLDFDVMPMPVVDDAATVGDLTGVCIAADTKELAASADFLVDLISTESVSEVAAAGYLSPANVEVALSDAFLQPGRLPQHSAIFYSSIRSMRIPPLLGNYAELEAAVSGPLQALLTVELPDLDALTLQIDEASQSVLAPESATEPPEDEESGE